jgi:phosphate transport system substrate-binding protein
LEQSGRVVLNLLNVMIDGYRELSDTCAPEEVVRKRQCGMMREDGRFIELLGGNVMVQKLINNPAALAIFSYSFLDQNRSLVKANPVEGVLPTMESIVQQRYSVARSLFVYIKQAHVGTITGLADFARFLVSDMAVGENGFLNVKGLIPVPDAERATIQKRAAEIH